MLMSRVYASIIYMRMVQAIKVRTYSGPAHGFAVHTWVRWPGREDESHQVALEASASQRVTILPVLQLSPLRTSGFGAAPRLVAAKLTGAPQQHGAAPQAAPPAGFFCKIAT